MANILLAEVPNVPQASPGIPDTGSAQRAVMQTFGELKGQLQQHQISGDAFGAPYEALKHIGAGLESLGSVGAEIANHEAQAKIDYQTSDAQNKMETAFSTFRASQPPTPDPDKMRADWQSNLKDVTDQVLGDNTLSPEAKQRIQISAMRFNRVSTAAIDSQARTLTFERAKEGFKNQAESLIENGEVEGAKQVYDTMAAKQLIYPEEAKQLSQFAERKGELTGYENQIQNGALAAQTKLASLWDGNGKFQPDKTSLSEQQALNLKKDADTAVHHQSVAFMENVIPLAETNQIRSVDDIKKMAEASGVKLTQTQIDVANIKRQQNQRPDPAALHQVIVDAQNWTKESDPTYEKYADIKAREYLLPAGYRDPVSKALEASDKGDRSTQTLITNRITKQVDELVKGGLLGNVSLDKNKQPVDQVGYEKAYTEATNLQIDFRNWLKSHPTSTTEQAQEFVNSQLKDKIKLPEPTWWQSHAPTWMGGSPAQPETTSASNPYASPTVSAIADAHKPTASVSDSLINQVKQWEDFTPKAKPDGKQMTVGYGTRATSANEELTKDQAESRLKTELGHHAAIIDSSAKANDWKLTPSQRNALISFDFNTGAGAKVLSESKNITDLQSKISEYTKQTQGSQKVQLPGLVNRRNAELALFNQ